jgi:hypothetical protein
MTAHTRAAKQRLEDLPAPSALPWLGNVHQPDPKWLLAQLEAWGQVRGPTYTFKLGPKCILVTSNVEIAPSALKDRPLPAPVHDRTCGRGDGEQRCFLN